MIADDRYSTCCRYNLVLFLNGGVLDSTEKRYVNTMIKELKTLTQKLN